MTEDTSKLQGKQSDDPSKTEADEPLSDQSSTGSSKQTGLPWGFVALTAAGTFLFFNKEKLGSEGGFIYIIGAVVLGILSANMLAPKKAKSIDKYTITDIKYTSPDEIPELLAVLTDKALSSSAKASARAKIEKVRPGSKEVVGNIVEALKNDQIKQSRIAFSLVKALSSIGPEASEAVPFLVSIMDTIDKDFKFLVCKALSMITKEKLYVDKDKWLQFIEQSINNR